MDSIMATLISEHPAANSHDEADTCYLAFHLLFSDRMSPKV